MPPPEKKESILLVNPWIYDFAAFDFWLKPLGLLYLGSILRKAGLAVSLLDGVNLGSLPEQFLKGLKPPRRKEFGLGHLYKEIIPRPKVLQAIPRHYRRYGIPPEVIKKRILALPRPDLILVTSGMTYWYTGLIATIELLRQNFPGIPIWLGGIYATLCPDHAQKYSGADQVLAGPWDREKGKFLGEYLGRPSLGIGEEFINWPYPAFDLFARLDYVCLLTRQGCPFSCTYCAVPQLNKGWVSKNPGQVIEEVVYWKEKFGVGHFAFYDDALLINPSGHIIPFLREVIARKIALSFHTPNALHAREIDEEVARLLFRSGFKTIRLGLETGDEIIQRATGGKVTSQEFQKAVKNLKKAGYSGEEIGVYLMAGLPAQRAKEVEESMAFVRSSGAKPILVEYSPIPGTPMFEEAKRFSPFDLENEPLWQNSSLFPCRWEGFTLEDFKRLKEKR